MTPPEIAGAHEGGREDFAAPSAHKLRSSRNGKDLSISHFNARTNFEFSSQKSDYGALEIKSGAQGDIHPAKVNKLEINDQNI